MYYAIQVQAGKEEYIITLINKKVSHVFFDEVFTPKKEVIRTNNGKETIKTNALFPGYIFVSSKHIKEFATFMIYLPQFAKVLGRDKITADFVPLNDEEQNMIDTLCGKDEDRILKTSFVSIQEGKNIKVIAGPLQGYEGKIKKVDLHKRIAVVEVSICGSIVDAQFAINFIKLLND